MDVFAQMEAAGVVPDVFTFNSLIMACANVKPSARVDDAMAVFVKMGTAGVVPNVVTFNSLITACANVKPSARVDDAMTVLAKMEAAGLVPDVVTFSSLITACANVRPSARVDVAMKVLAKMEAAKVVPTVVTLSSLIKACASVLPAADIRRCRLLVDQMVRFGITPDEYALPAMIKCCGYARPRATKQAIEWFERFERFIPVHLNSHVEKALSGAIGDRADKLVRLARVAAQSLRVAAIALRQYIVESHGAGGVLEPSLLPTTFFQDKPWAKTRIDNSKLSPSQFCKRFPDVLEWCQEGTGGVKAK
jgi:pentatricopeptide repeat protein